MIPPPKSSRHSRTKKIPRSYPEKVALDEDVVVSQDMLNVHRIIDNNAWGQ